MFKVGDKVCFVNANNQLILGCTVLSVFTQDGKERVELEYRDGSGRYAASPTSDRVAPDYLTETLTTLALHQKSLRAISPNLARELALIVRRPDLAS